MTCELRIYWYSNVKLKWNERVVIKRGHVRASLAASDRTTYSRQTTSAGWRSPEQPRKTSGNLASLRAQRKLVTNSMLEPSLLFLT